jgi:hypothetical protein
MIWIRRSPRSQILKKLKRNKEAHKDYLNAKLHAYPYEPRPYDIEFTKEAAQKRREHAVSFMSQQKWAEAVKLLDLTVTIHEAGPKRCKVLCMYCGDQEQALRNHAKALKSAKRLKEAAASQAMSEAAVCPVGVKLVGFKWYFPAGRAGWGNPSKSDLGYIEEYLRGGVHSYEGRRKVRYQLSADLKLRARAFEQLGRTDDAAKDRRRAQALTYLSGPTWHRPRQGVTRVMTLPEKYVEILQNK